MRTKKDLERTLDELLKLIRSKNFLDESTDEEFIKVCDRYMDMQKEYYLITNTYRTPDKRFK